MRPTPQKLAVLMSLAGLGLSLGDSALAKSEPTVRPNREATGLDALMVDGDEAPSTRADGPAQIPDGPLDVLLPLHSAVPALSDEDRAAVALAMVLMAEPWPESTALAPPEFSEPTERWEAIPQFVRDFRDAASRGESRASSEATETVQASSSDMPLAMRTAATPGAMTERLPTTSGAAAVDLEFALATTHLDLDLDIDIDIDGAKPVSAAHPVIDASLEPSLALDLNLDLGLGLDLNLDVAPELDLRLDRPPVFAVTRLRPQGRAGSATFARAADAVLTCTAAEPIAAKAATTVPVALPTPTLAPSRAVASPRIESIAPSAAVAHETEVAPRVAATIVVASHADRVLRSLEVVVSTGHAAPGFDARAQEVFVTSHAEKALLMLASTCAGEESSQTVDHLPRVSKVDLARPATACTPMVRDPASGGALRHAAIGGGAVALSQGDLDKVRGGFDTPTGLKISFGIERAVYINGSLVTTTSLNVSDLGKVTGGAGSAVASAVAGSGSLTLIQNGPGNTFQAGPISAATVGTIVQNTLNDQKIQNVTAINATVNSLQMVRAQNLQSTLRGAIIDSLRR